MSDRRRAGAGEMARVESFDGVRIAYGVAGAESGASAVLLHHGFASTAYVNWVRPGLVDALVQAGRRVVFLDARGHGAADHPHDPAAYRPGAMARDVTVLLDELGLERVDMAGYSMGAFVALECATGERRLRSLFLGGAGASQLEGRRGDGRAIAEALEADDPAEISDLSARSFRNFADAVGQDRLALAALQRAMRFPAPGDVASVRVPTLVVNGERDTLAGAPSRLAAEIEGAGFATVPGDHLSAVMQPQFKELIVSWERGR